MVAIMVAILTEVEGIVVAVMVVEAVQWTAAVVVTVVVVYISKQTH